MKAAFMRSPYEFMVKDIELRAIKETEVLIKIKSCGLCGYDLILASAGTENWQPFGHEVSGIVEQTGRKVKNVQPGDKVVLQSGTFDRFSENVLNGRADLDTQGVTLWPDDGRTMGFAEYIIVSMELCVKFDDISYEEACMAEPLGVAVDLVRTADIGLNDNVLVVGLGPIGLMALKLAGFMGASRVYGATRSYANAKNRVAEKFGVHEIIYTDTDSLLNLKMPKGGINKILITAPPSSIVPAIDICARGGVITYLGIEYGENAQITFDANKFHFNKLQLRSSFASPCLNFPQSIDLIRSGMVPVKELITNYFVIDEISRAIDSFRKDKKNTIKAVMTSDSQFIN